MCINYFWYNSNFDDIQANPDVLTFKKIKNYVKILTVVSDWLEGVNILIPISKFFIISKYYFYFSKKQVTIVLLKMILFMGFFFYSFSRT